MWHELAFGLEKFRRANRRNSQTRRGDRAFFGIASWFEKSVYELSGGQKQILNLAAVMAMQPDIIILDEPTAQLDPIAAKEFLQAVKRVNEELGKTVILLNIGWMTHCPWQITPLSARWEKMDFGSPRNLPGGA